MSVHPSVEPTATVAAAPQTQTGRRGWTTGRTVSLVAGGILGLASLGLLGAGGWATWQTTTQRDAAGYLTTSTHNVAAAGPAITSIEVGELADRAWSGALGDVRLRATSTDRATGVFIGVAPTAAVNGYLGDVDRTAVTEWFPVATQDVPGLAAAVKTAPSDARIWSAQVSGTGRQALTWRPTSETTVVVMHPDGSAGVSAAIDFGAKAPGLTWLAVVCLAVGGLLAGAAAVVITVPVRRARS